jgi:hypothetical protein
MSASEKVKALDLEPFAFVEDQSGTTAVAIELSRFRQWQAVHPQIVAVVEAAQDAADHFIDQSAHDHGWPIDLKAALAALDETLS